MFFKRTEKRPPLQKPEAHAHANPHCVQQSSVRPPTKNSRSADSRAGDLALPRGYDSACRALASVPDCTQNTALHRQCQFTPFAAVLVSTRRVSTSTLLTGGLFLYQCCKHNAPPASAYSTSLFSGTQLTCAPQQISALPGPQAKTPKGRSTTIPRKPLPARYTKSTPFPGSHRLNFLKRASTQHHASPYISLRIRKHETHFLQNQQSACLFSFLVF